MTFMKHNNYILIVSGRTGRVSACLHGKGAAVIVLAVHELEVDAASAGHVVMFVEEV